MPFDFGQDQSEQSYQDMVSHRPAATTYEDARDATAEDSFLGTAMGLIARRMAVNELESQTDQKISADEANKRFPGLDTPFREEVNPYVAQYTYDRFMERREREEKIANGPSDTWSKTKLLGVGILTHLMDPIETGANIMGGWAVGGAIKAGAFGARAASVAKAGMAAPLASRIGVGAIEQGTIELGINTGLGVGEFDAVS